jgi:hypothetical protein
MIADIRLHWRRGYRFARQILVEELPSALTVSKIPKAPLNPLHDCRIGCEIDGLANRELSRLRARDAALRLKDLIDRDEFVDIGLQADRVNGLGRRHARQNLAGLHGDHAHADGDGILLVLYVAAYAEEVAADRQSASAAAASRRPLRIRLAWRAPTGVLEEDC